MKKPELLFTPHEKKSPNIHEVYSPYGKEYVVCVWDEAANNYARPLDNQERKLTGCNIQFAKTLDTFDKFTKKQAYSRASYLFGYAKIDRGY